MHASDLRSYNSRSSEEVTAQMRRSGTGSVADMVKAAHKPTKQKPGKGNIKFNVMDGFQSGTANTSNRKSEVNYICTEDKCLNGTHPVQYKFQKVFSAIGNVATETMTNVMLLLLEYEWNLTLQKHVQRLSML